MACEDPTCDICIDVTGCLVSTLKSMTRDLMEADADRDFLRETLASVLDYVRGWDTMPQALVDDIDAALDGNAETTV